MEGEVASKEMYGNARGIGRNGQAVWVFDNHITACATYYNGILSANGLATVPDLARTLRAQVVAHEVGHQFNLEHYRRTASVTATAPPSSTTTYHKLMAGFPVAPGSTVLGPPDAVILAIFDIYHPPCPRARQGAAAG